MSTVLTWQERCERHPDHQQGMVTHGMIAQRMQEEIDELREALAEARTALLHYHLYLGGWSGPKHLLEAHEATIKAARNLLG